MTASTKSTIIINNGGIIKPPIIISTNPNHIELPQLSKLYRSCHHSPTRRPAAVDAAKLAVAVHHSAAVVAVFSAAEGGGGGIWRRRMGEKGDLVGFGRAVSDLALTASIYDVMVIPELRRLGIGRMIVQRILRMLVTRGIYDISALCSDNERSFFAACGFGDDLLGSTTMTYAGSFSGDSDSEQKITPDSRGLLLAPPSRLPLS
ncbi:hypothetical protein vseg_008791 [Gypsophila vaccaria]